MILEYRGEKKPFVEGALFNGQAGELMLEDRAAMCEWSVVTGRGSASGARSGGW
jgi:hypothetical protein